MINFNIDKKNFTISGLEGYRYKKNFFNDKYTLFFFGFFRTPIKDIEDIINEFEKKNFSEENIEKIFKKIGGICTLLIQNKDEIKICASLYHGYLKIFNNDDELIVTDEEFYKERKEFQGLKT